MVLPKIDKVDTLPRQEGESYGSVPLHRKTKYVIHHSDADKGTPEGIAKFHIAPKGTAPNGRPTGNDWPGCGYQVVTERNGQRTQCQRWETVSYHCGGFNSITVGNCLIGDHSHYLPTEEQMAATVQDIIEFNEETGQRAEITTHKLLKPGYECPGDLFPIQEIRDRVAAYYRAIEEEPVVEEPQEPVVDVPPVEPEPVDPEPPVAPVPPKGPTFTSKSFIIIAAVLSALMLAGVLYIIL